jgi:hypothetical protein
VRPGADQRHLAAQHMNELWKLVQARSAQKAANWGDPLVFL